MILEIKNELDKISSPSLYLSNLHYLKLDFNIKVSFVSISQ
ncbi:hypothetical protein FM120_30515 [Sphingobacterium faecium PCAi_F2.5]|nr:hypothetical protein FM120_30515 [Sphingobacterium faecium PCAi_F2.5]